MLRTEWDKTITNKSSFRKEYEIITASGDVKWLLKQGVGVYDKEEKLMFLEGYIEDITDLKNTEIQLLESEEKNRLIMDHSMDAILLTKPDGSILSTNKAACKLFDQVDFFHLQAEQKGIELYISEQIPADKAFVETDKNKLNSVLSNLVKNAIKFTTEGKIQLGNYTENNSLVIYVKDSGCGISAEKIESVFKRFMQADTSLTRAHEGSGLGLTIAKVYVNLIGGKIWVESQVERGSTFYFSIPYNVKPDENITPTRKGVMLKDYSNEKTILIAEDDETSFKYLKVILKHKNINPVRAVNGEEAIQIFRDNPDISLILMDIKMPVMDGIEAMKEIRNFNKTVPIVVQSAYALSGDDVKAKLAGCSDYITKPLKPADLFLILDKYLK